MMMHTLPPAEDAEEASMDIAVIRYSIDLDLALYRRLLAEQYLRQRSGKRVSMREIIGTLLDTHLPPDPHAEAC